MNKEVEEQVSLKDLDNIKDCIMTYQLLDAWNMPIKSIYVKDNEVIVVSDRIKKYAFKTQKLIDILNNYTKEYKSINDKVLPLSPVLDGYINKLTFKVNDKEYEIEENNLAFYSDDDVKESKYLNFIIRLYNDIYDELISQIPDIENYFVLSDEEEEDE
jgi:hypothetical protein